MEVNVSLCPVTGVVTRKQNVCIVSYLSRQKKSSTPNNTHVIASPIIKNYNYIFSIDIIHYTLFNYKLLAIT